MCRLSASMKPSSALVGLASVATLLALGTDGFIAPPSSLPSGAGISGTHDAVSSTVAARRRPLLPDHPTSRRHRQEPSSLLMMAAGGKKRRRRKAGKDAGTAAAPAASPAKSPADAAAAVAGGGGGAGKLGDVLEGDRGVEALFTDDWSDMPANTGMVKTSVSVLVCFHLFPAGNESKRGDTISGGDSLEGTVVPAPQAVACALPNLSVRISEWLRGRQ